LLPSDAAVADSRFVLNYFRLSADKRLIFGGGERYSQTPPRDIAAFVRPFIAAGVPADNSPHTKIDYGWGGAVAVTMNRLPHIGRRGNVFYAHGFSGHGALVTTLAGELIAEAMAGTAERFDVLANLPSKPVSRRQMAAPAARDARAALLCDEGQARMITDSAIARVASRRGRATFAPPTPAPSRITPPPRAGSSRSPSTGCATGPVPVPIVAASGNKPPR
jgi:hypothetical protein